MVILVEMLCYLWKRHHGKYTESVSIKTSIRLDTRKRTSRRKSVILVLAAVGVNGVLGRRVLSLVELELLKEQEVEILSY